MGEKKLENLLKWKLQDWSQKEGIFHYVAGESNNDSSQAVHKHQCTSFWNKEINRIIKKIIQVQFKH